MAIRGSEDNDFYQILKQNPLPYSTTIKDTLNKANATEGYNILGDRLKEIIAATLAQNTVQPQPEPPPMELLLTKEEIIPQPQQREVVRTEPQSQPQPKSQPAQPIQTSENQGAAMVNAATETALRKSGANFSNESLNPYAYREISPRLVNLKQLYENADNPALQRTLGLTADQIRERANVSADYYRQLGDTAGYDLSRYGSDVSYSDAYSNLQTEKARAIVDLTQGKYSMPSDQFYDVKYQELRENGLPVGRAQRAAAEFARRYQAERVNYLNDALYGYGYDGRIMTDLGRKIVADLAREGQGEIANMYLNGKANDKEAYAQESALARELAQLTASGQNAQALAILNHELGLDDKSADLENYMTRYNFESKINKADEIDRETRSYQWGRLNAKQGRIDDMRKLRDAINFNVEILTSAGLSPQQALIQIAKKEGYLPKDKDSTGFNKDYANSLKGFLDTVTDYSKNLQEQLASYEKGSNEYKMIIQELEENQKVIDNIRNAIPGIHGLGGAKDTEINEYDPKNENGNSKSIAAIVAYCITNKKSPEEAVKMVYEWSGGLLQPEIILQRVNEEFSKQGGGNGNGQNR